MKKSIVITTVAVAILLLLFFLMRKCSNTEVVTTVIEKTDTSYIEKHDTVYFEKYYRLPSIIDTFIVFKENRDTLYIHGIALDTINIDSLKLELSGVETIIHDSIIIKKDIFKDERFSLNAGGSVSYCNKCPSKIDFGINMGATFSKGNNVVMGYDFLNRRISIGYTKKIFGIK